jgi:DNA repair exonuclease SbcCD ATPase subunit
MIDLSEPGLTLIMGENQKEGGSNASGKSTAIVDSITYTLFGKTTKNLKADEVINNKTKKNCFVELGFEINQKNYIIRRWRAHEDFGNRLTLEENGVDISKDKMSDTQDLIESIILIGFKPFVQSIVLSQENIANFASAGPLDRKGIVENLLMFSFITQYHKSTKEILRKINPQLEILHNTYTDKKATVKTLTDNLLKYIEKWENEIKSKKIRIELLQEQIDQWKHIDIDKEIKTLQAKTQKTRIRDELATKKEHLDDNIFRTKEYKKQLDKKVKEKEKEIAAVNKNPELCPVCGSEIKKDVLKEYLDRKQKEVDTLKTDSKTQEHYLQECTDNLVIVKKDLETNGLELEQLNILLTTNLTEVQVTNIKQTITQAESEIKILGEQIGGDIELDEYIADTESKIQEIKNEIKDIRLKIKKLEYDAKLFEWWKEALSNSPSSMKTFSVNQILISLNKYINYYLNFFGFNIVYSLSAELEDTITKDGELISFGALSGGEKRSVEISLVFALYEIVRIRLPDNINIIVLDELLSRYLDEVRITDALGILNELEERQLSIFVIDHKNLIKESLSCKTINITKGKNGFSTLEVQQA